MFPAFPKKLAPVATAPAFTPGFVTTAGRLDPVPNCLGLTFVDFFSVPFITLPIRLPRPFLGESGFC